MKAVKKRIEVVAAIIICEDKILCVQRGKNKFSYISKKYEFPGGKIEQGETFSQALIREVDEELKMKVKPKKRFITVEHEYPDFKLIMHTVKCTCANSEVTLTEHLDFKWLPIENLESLDWAAADIPVVNELLKEHEELLKT